MKNTFSLTIARYQLTAQALLAGFAFMLCISATAQNLLKNGDFEQPLGPTNWTVKYLFGGTNEFEIHDRIRGASMYSQASAIRFFGGCFRPKTLKLGHAYFTQTVTNLTPGHEYYFVGNMMEDWWKKLSPLRNKFLVYMEVLGGQGNPLPDGRFSMVATNDFYDSTGNSETNIDAPFTYATGVWRPFYAQQTPDANRRIEVRMHYNKIDFAIYDKTYTSAAYFDDLWLTVNP